MIEGIKDIDDKKNGVYIHIPFCASKCHYCDFNSWVPKKNEIDEYIDLLSKEMKLYTIENVDTIFIGGGTPSILNVEQLERLFNVISKNVKVDEICEYTVECNPGTLSSEKLKVMKKYGVNRLSMGLQSTHIEDLNLMGRIHTPMDFEKNFYEARKLGFENISVDLIFAFDGQTMKKWKETLEYVVKISPDHISAYSLIIEPNTRFFDMYENGDLKEYDEDGYILLNRYTKDYLERNGYSQYEISNFSKIKKECKHNIKYWEGDKYFAFGVSASGYIGNERYNNFSDLKKYTQCVLKGKKPIENIDVLDRKKLFNEKIFLGLRQNKGIDITKTCELLNEEERDYLKKNIEKFVKKGYIEHKDSNIFLTQSGREISNAIFIDLMID